MINSYIDTVKTGKNIRRYIKEKGLTVQKVADKLGLNSVQAIYKWESGDCLPKIDNIFALCYLLEVSPLDICIFYDDEFAKSINRICKGAVEYDRE